MYIHVDIYDIIECTYILVPFPQDEEVEIAISKSHGRLVGQRRMLKEESGFLFLFLSFF